MAKLIDMKRTPEPQHEMPTPPAAVPDISFYPHQLTIALEDEELEKLSLNGDLPSVGDMLHLEVMAKVTSATESSHEVIDGGKKRCRVELQLTHIGTEDNEELDRGERWYGSQEDGE